VFVRNVAVLVILGLLAPSALGQQYDRRARDEPEIVVEAGGRSGTCDVLRFTRDGQFLLAAGDDKVVHVWPHLANGLDKTPGKAKTLRWRSWRDQLGGIKAIGVSPDGKQIAVGGYGLRISSVAIIDRETGNTTAITWPRSGEGVSNFDAVMAIAFHPDGKRIGFGTADGTLWLWNPTKLPVRDQKEGREWNAPARVGRFECKKDAQGDEIYELPKAIHFPDKETLVAVSDSGQVLACDVTGPLSDDFSRPIPTGKLLFNINENQKTKYLVYQAEWTGDGKWLIAAMGGPLVLLRSADGKQTVRLEMPEDHFPRGLAIHAKTGKVAIGVGKAPPLVAGQPRFFIEGDYQIWVYDNPTVGKPVEPTRIQHTGRVEALAFHPEENRLAVAGGDADEVTLLDPARPSEPVSIIRGTGRHLMGVNLSETGDVLGVRTGRNAKAVHANDVSAGPWVRFDLNRFTVTADQTNKWVDPIREANGWSIVPDENSRYIWYAERRRADGGKDRFRLGLNRDLDIAPTCYTFVPTPDGRPTRVLIGHYYGCSLFELAPERVVKNERTKVLELRRTKLFIGHGAEVTSVVASKDGTWFVTASNDQTVAGWSLVDWTAQSPLGAAFEVKEGQLTVTSVDVGSPAYEAGLTKGDLIDGLGVDGKIIYDRRKDKLAVGTAEVAASALKNPQSGVELAFSWVSPGQEGHRATPTRLKQRPLWKWFPAFDEQNRLTDSVVWMWHGSYYYTSSTHGDRMIGWHMNDGEVGGTPTYHPLERFKHLFLKPDAIARLFATRSVEEALKEVQDVNQRRKFRDVEPAPVTLAIKQGAVRGEDVPVTVTVNPQGNNLDLIPNRIELWVNDYRFETWAGKGKDALKLDVKIPADAFRAGDNQITVLAMNPARGRAEDSRFISNPIEMKNSDLHGLAIGINDYSSHRKAVNGVRAFGDLGKARADAEDFQSKILTYRGQGKCFPEGNLALFLDAAADRKSLIAAFKDLKNSKVKADDLLVVFFAGHGDLLTANGKGPLELTPGRGLAADNGLFVFCCPNYVPSKATATALSGEELFDLLADVKCRKLVLLDTCHAGGAIETNLLRRFIPNGQGPFVIAACDQSEQSFEDNKLGHGVFTYAVLEAFGSQFRKADVNSDGQLSPKELFDYVRDRVPELMKEVKPGNTQNPICFPHADSLPTIAIVTK
jgi:WD40 repeat protein